MVHQSSIIGKGIIKSPTSDEGIIKGPTGVIKGPKSGEGIIKGPTRVMRVSLRVLQE